MEQGDGSVSQVTAAEIEKWKQLALTEHEMYLRVLADFDNYRKRVERERESAAAEGKKEVLSDLLEIVDGFDKALSHLSDVPESVAEGLRALGRQLSTLLERHHVTRVPSVGHPFNAAVHEAIDTVQTDKYPPGLVIDELQPGYRLNGELLRPARVRVAA